MPQPKNSSRIDLGGLSRSGTTSKKATEGFIRFGGGSSTVTGMCESDPKGNILTQIVGANIKRFRIMNEYQREDLARAIDVHLSAVAQWELGYRYPRSEHIVKMADLFNLDVTDFFRRGSIVQALDESRIRKIVREELAGVTPK